MEHWTDEQKTFAKGKQFALLVCFGDNEDIDKHIFENHPVLQYMINLQAEFIHDGMGYAAYEVIAVKIDQPVLVLHYDYAKTVVSYFDKGQDADIFIYNSKKELKKEIDLYEADGRNSCILEANKFWKIDLRSKVPYFYTYLCKNK